MGLLPLALLLAMTTNPWEREVVYQIFPRSYCDSNGDRIGDLKGIAQKLDVVKELGATAILINPIQASRTYHNYFADDFLAVDKEFGTNDDFRELCRLAHRKKMKVLLDMEPQYVTDKHAWWAPKFSDYVWREGSWLYGYDNIWFDGTRINVAAINPGNPRVREEVTRVFLYWQSLGADGFRLDHCMDDLDGKGRHTGMLAGFWRPIVDACRKVNPKAFFVAEQSDWGGPVRSYYEVAGVDATYAFGLKPALLSLDKAKIEKALILSSERAQFLFVENHDMARFASEVKGDPALLRLGAVLVLTAKGVPILYYGQELGMTGRQGKWNSDGNDIPVRLAYRWSKRLDAPGSAIWYKGTGPWGRTRFERNDGGTSLEEQKADDSSLYRFYQRLISLRRSNPALSGGDLKVVNVGGPSVLVVRRRSSKRLAYIALNLSDKPQTVSLSDRRVVKDLWSHEDVREGPVALGPYGIRIIGD